MGKTLRGYLTREIVARFAGGLALFTLVLLAARIIEMVDLVLARGVPPRAIATLFLLILPTFVELTSPVAAMMGVLVTFTRLSSDGELVAMRAAGLSWASLVRPVLRFGVVVAVCSLSVATFVRPWANERISTSIYELAKVHATAVLRPRVFHSSFAGIVLYVADVTGDTGEVTGILLADERDPRAPTTVFAAAGTVIADESRKSVRLQLRDGTSLTRHGDTESYDLTSFATFDVHLDPAADGRSTVAAADPTHLSLRDLLAATSTDRDQAQAARIEIHRKVAFAIAAILFAILGVPLGAAGTGGGRGRGLAASIGIALVYYLLFSAAVVIARRTQIPVGIALSLPNVIFTLAAAYLLARLERDQPLLRHRAVAGNVR